MNSNELLISWRERARRAQKAHFESSSICTRNHYVLGVFVVVMSTVVGSALIGRFIPEIAIAAISILVAALAAIQTFLKLPERAEKHRIVAAKLSNVKKRIEELDAFTQGDELKQNIERIRIDWDHILEDAPTSLRAVWRKYAKTKTK